MSMRAKRVDSDGFILVKNRRRNGVHKNINKTNSVIMNELCSDFSDDLTDGLNDNQVIEKVWSCVEHLTNSNYVNIVLKSFKACLSAKNTRLTDHQITIICYGLGNFSKTRSSLYQLALLIAIKQLINCKHIYIYDPIFTANELNILENTFDINICTDGVSDGNECHNISIDSLNCDTKLLYYMPHCHKSLFNSVLHANWRTTKLDNIYILGNSFNNMLDTIVSKRIALKLYSYLYNVVNVFSDTVIECTISNSFIFKEIFNDFSIHAFNVQNVKENVLQQYFTEHKPLNDYNEEYD